MKTYSSTIYELMARYLAGESGAEEAKRLETILAEDAELSADFERMKLLFYNKGAALQKENPDEKHFSRLSKRLKDEGLM